MKSLFTSLGAVLAALAACTCCVGPLLALAGMLGVSASHLVWLSSIKSYLIGFSLIAIGYNLYRAYYPKKQSSCCSIEDSEALANLTNEEQRTVSFFQSKRFLWSIAILTIIILLLPYL